MNIKKVYPYLVCGSFLKDNVWVFFCFVGEIKIEGANDLLRDLLPLCDGTLTVKKIVENLKKIHWESKKVIDIVKQLFDLGVLADKHHLFEVWRRYSENPMIFCQKISESGVANLMAQPLPADEISYSVKSNFKKSTLTKILEKRRSIREFTDGVISKNQLFGLFWSAYGRQQERTKKWKYGDERTLTVPSGGALFPLVLYLFLLCDVADLKKGIYRWDGDNLDLSFLKNQKDLSNMANIIDGINSLKNAVGVMAVFTDYNRIARKYSNKAYSLGLLEAGHVMQNAYLFCAERNIGFVEILGFYHEPLKAMISGSRLEPVVVGVFGNIKKEGE